MEKSLKEQLKERYINHQYNSIVKKLENAADNGKTQIYVFMPITKRTLGRLKKEGLNVKIISSKQNSSSEVVVDFNA